MVRYLYLSKFYFIVRIIISASLSTLYFCIIFKKTKMKEGNNLQKNKQRRCPISERISEGLQRCSWVISEIETRPGLSKEIWEYFI